MAKYNNGKKYNFLGNKGGINYNSKPYVKTFYINEEIGIRDEISLTNVSLMLKESFSLNDSIVLMSSFSINENSSIKDFVESMIVLEFLEKIGINDKETILNVLLENISNIDIRENIHTIARMDINEKNKIQDSIILNALLNANDYGFSKEDIEQFTIIDLFDFARILDTEPKKAISDFYINGEGYFSPFNLYVNYGKTNIGFMPTATDTSINIAGKDGEIVQNTKYESRLIEIFAVTEDGLTPSEKAEAKRMISEILHSIKNSTKKLTISSDDITFDVKYSGTAGISIQAHNWLEFDLPFKSASPYAKSMFTSKLKGSGLIYNSGMVECGIIFEIKGRCTNPTLYLNGQRMTYTGTVESGSTLIIDTNKSICKMIYSNNTTLNAMDGYNKVFPKAEIGGNVLTVSGDIDCTAKWTELFL